MELKTVGKFSSCISDVDFELLNTKFIVDLCFGFGKPNTCVGFAGLDLNSFGTTLLQHHTVYIRGTRWKEESEKFSLPLSPKIFHKIILKSW